MMRMRAYLESLKTRGHVGDAPLLERDALRELASRSRHLGALDGTRPEAAWPRLGDTRSPYRGSGLDYEDSRPYQPGDELRHINWRLSARSGTPQTKIFREERRPGVFVVVDRRGSMRFGTRTRPKCTQAAICTALIAFAARDRGASVGGLLLAEEIQWLGPGRGDRAVFRLIAGAAAPCPPRSGHPWPGLPGLLPRLRLALPAGTALYLVSDFGDLGSEDRRALLQLATRHAVAAICITDPAEAVLPAAGPVTLVSDRDGSERIVDTDDPALRADFAAAAARARETRRRLLTGGGADYCEVGTTEPRPEARIPWLGD